MDTPDKYSNRQNCNFTKIWIHYYDCRSRRTPLTCFLTARDSTAFHLCLTTSTGWFYSREVLWMKATHRAITAHTMAEVLEGRYNHKIRSVRIIDCRYCLLKITFVRINANMFNCPSSRYKFEFDGGHIRGAENWQHGEVHNSSSSWKRALPVPMIGPRLSIMLGFAQDDEFLNGFFPPLKPPLSKAPASYDAVTWVESTDNLNSINITSSPFNLSQTWQCRGREARHLGLSLRVFEQEGAGLLHEAQDQG